MGLIIIGDPEASTSCISQFRNASPFSFKRMSGMFDSYVSVPICSLFFFLIHLPPLEKKEKILYCIAASFKSTIDSSEYIAIVLFPKFYF